MAAVTDDAPDGGQPYSRRDPYWGTDDYGRPLSYGRPSIYGPPEPVDADQFAEQLTYLQSGPNQRPIDPGALKAPSVFRPLWPTSVQPVAPLLKPPVSDPVDDDQVTELVNVELGGVELGGVEQDTMRFTSASVPGSVLGHDTHTEQETVRVASLGAHRSEPAATATADTALVNTALVETALGDIDEQVTIVAARSFAPSAGPVTAAQFARFPPAPQPDPAAFHAPSYAPSYAPNYAPNIAPPYPEFATPTGPSHKRNRRRGRFLLIAVVVVALLAGGVWFYRAGFSDSSASRDLGLTGAFEQSWQTADSHLTLDMIVIDDVVVSVECQPASDAATPGVSVPNSAQGPAIRTHESPESCSLNGRAVADGQTRWKLDRQPIGVALAAVGSMVVAYGGEQASVVSAATGEITRTLREGVLLGYAGTTAVFTERLGDASNRAVAVDVTDGRQLWQTPIAQNPATENARALRQASIAVPTGFDRMYYDGMGGDSRYVMVPDADTAGQYQIRVTATGELAAADGNKAPATDAAQAPAVDGQVFGVAGGHALHVIGTGADRVLHGTNLNSDTEPRDAEDGAAAATGPWSYDLPAGGYVAACSGLVCVQDVNAHRSVVLDPASGETVYRNDSGWSYARRSGDLAVVVRCPAAQDISVCPIAGADVEAISVSDRAVVWRGKQPVFVAVQGREVDAPLLVGVADADRVQVYAFSEQTVSGGSGTPSTVGTVPLRGVESVMLGAENSATGADQPQETVAVPNVSCVATETTVSCGARWQATPTTTWSITLGAG